MNEFKLGPKQEKWLQALESGEYKQCTQQLRKEGGFCCLGVADEVLKLGEMSNAGLDFTYQKLGLRSPIGRVVSDTAGRHAPLAIRNDNGMTFKEIAAYIRANPENVFTESK